jgi:polyisoprenoid-binding protein YceI
MKTFKSIFSIVLIVFMSAGMVHAQTHQVNTDKSTMKWLGKKVGGQHNGAVKVKSGELTKGKNDALTGNFVIDMTTITDEDLTDKTYNEKLIGHLKSDDFFSIEKFPISTFKITNAVAKNGENGNNYEVTGELTIKGITHSITFPANVMFTSSGFIAKAKINVDRSKYDVRYGSGAFFDNLGDKTIEDNILFDLYIVSK